jgi:hypothetical protein
MSTPPTVDRAAAEAFVREQARLIDVRRFERRFAEGSTVAVRAALDAYRNADGGYAGLLEPDLRTTTSQPQSAELALRVLDELRAPGDPAPGQALELCDWLATVKAPTGGVPFTHPSARRHPAAPHWHHADGRTASLNPTAAIVGLLHRLGVRHRWLEEARAFCWSALGVAPGGRGAGRPRGEGGEGTPPAGTETLDLYSVRAALWLLDPAVPEAPDPDALRRALAAGVAEHVALDPALTAPEAPGHHIGPLDVAPFPGDPGRAFLPPEAVEAALDALAGRQASDGGWPVNFAPISSAATAEWRGWATVQALAVLDAAGRLG